MKTLSRTQPTIEEQPPLSAAAISKPKAKRRAQVAEHTLTDVERRKLFRTIKGHSCPLAQRDYHLFRFIALQGPRVGSVAQFSCGDVRLWLHHNNMIVRDEIAKNGNGYAPPLRAEARRELESLIKLRAKRQHIEPFDFNGAASDRDDELFLWGHRGVRMSDRTIQQRLQKWRELADLSVAPSPHWLRHGLAYEINGKAEHQNPTAVVGLMLGQSSATVSKMYGKPSRQELVDAIPSYKD